MKNRFTGIMNVFKFAYIQSVKGKAFAVVMIILCSLGLFALPVINAISKASEDETEKANAELISKIYVCDKALDGKLAENIVDIIKESVEYGGKDCAIVSEDEYDDTYNAIKASKNGEILVEITYGSDPESLAYGFSYVVYYGEKVEKLDEASDEFATYVDGIHKEALGRSYAPTQEGANLLSYNFISETIMLDSEGEVVEEEVALDGIEYWISYIFLMVSIFAISILGAKVSEQIVTEKSSKVIEYIMTSIKPMALVTGKVLASLSVLLTMLGGVVLSFVGSIFLNGFLFKEADGSMALPGFVKSIIEHKAFDGVGIMNIISALVVFVLGYLMFGFLAGIAGATVSKVEEMAEGLKIFTFAMIIGAYVVIAYMSSATARADWGAFTNFVYLFPLCAPFIVPSSLLLGKMSIGLGLLSGAILIVMIALLMIFVATVYEYLIYYNGSPMKLKELIKIFRKKGGAK